MSPSPPVHAKPRSMYAGERNVVRSNDSASLWNCTLSPGWSVDQSETLRLAVMKYGIGNWAKIIDSGCLPGKTNAQMNLQLQRLLGQQSTAEFAGLHIDPKVIGEQNSKIQGPEIKRKNNTIVNTGGKLSREELRERVARNKRLYEIPEEEWKIIVIETAEDNDAALNEKKAKIRELKRHLKHIQKQIQDMELLQPARAAKLKEQAKAARAAKAAKAAKKAKARKSTTEEKASPSEPAAVSAEVSASVSSPSGSASGTSTPRSSAGTPK